MTVTTATVIFRAADGTVVGTSLMTGGVLVGCDIPPGAVRMDVTAVTTSSLPAA